MNTIIGAGNEVLNRSTLALIVQYWLALYAQNDLYSTYQYSTRNTKLMAFLSWQINNILALCSANNLQILYKLMRHAYFNFEKVGLV
jgi:hypothetical protein